MIVKSKPLISIIVPVFNVENYLQRCIDSILAQTFTNYELILIDDGSTDRSGSICDNYALKDCRIKVFHINNGGVSNARNTGISNAIGEYLMFCDSDDYVEENWCSQLYEAIKENQKVLPVSGIRFIYNFPNQSSETVKVFSQNIKFDKSQYFETYKVGLSASLCCKIYDRKVIINNSLYFDTSVNRGEDLLFNLSYACFMDSIITIPIVSYNYVHSNTNSLVNSYRRDLSEINIMVYSAWKEYFTHLRVKGKQIEEFTSYFYLNFLFMLKNTFDERNTDNIIKKLKLNNEILNSKEFKECLDGADTSREDIRYIKLLKTKNYYFVWCAEQIMKVKKYLMKLIYV